MLAWLVRPQLTWAQVMFIVAAVAALGTVLGALGVVKVALGWLAPVAVLFIAVGLFLAF